MSTIITRRNLLIGIGVTAPAIVRPDSIMPIFSVDDWNPEVLTYEKAILTTMSASPYRYKNLLLRKISVFNLIERNAVYDPRLHAGKMLYMTLQQRADYLNQKELLHYSGPERLVYHVTRKYG
jgi:hypothetical protein